MAMILLFCLALLNCGGGGGSSTPPPAPPTPTVNVSVSPASVNAGQAATLTWTSTLVSSCTASGAWQDSPATSGSVSLAQVAPGTYTYKLTCTGTSGTANGSATLTVTSATTQVAVPLPGPAAPCTSNCYYVDANSGADTNDGRTAATAFKTLQKAAAVVAPGDTVTAMSGTYSDLNNNWLKLTTSGTPSAWIRFIAGAGQHPVIQLSNSDWDGIEISASYIVIDGFEVVGQDQSITPAVGNSGNGSQPLLNESCIVVNGVGGPVPHDIVIRNNIVHDCSEDGIGLVIGDAVTVAYNTVYNNSWWTAYDSSGISLYHLTDAPGSTTTNGYKNFIVGNTAYNNYNNIPFLSVIPQVITDGNGIIIDDNRHTQSALGTTDVKGVPYTGRTYIANNIVYSNGGRGIHAYASAHVDMVNNTTYNNLFTPSIPWAEIDAWECYDTNIVNNIAMNLSAKQVSLDDGNTYWNNLWSGSNVPLLGTNGIKQDPLFVDAAHANFTPGAGSPAFASGTAALAPLIDISGNARPAAKVDRGAVQVTK